MCGIAGMIDFKEDLRSQGQTAEKMQRAIRRRGFDQKGIYLTEHAGLIHTRLAVIDPENGRQPMVFKEQSETYTIIYNGEIYNTSEVRQMLEKKGYIFQTHSDTEVILKAYACYGSECVKLLNGIFAFAVWEEQKERLFLARDRIGVKPLFYYETEQGIIFGSELKAILAHPAVPHEIPAVACSGI